MSNTFIPTLEGDAADRFVREAAENSRNARIRSNGPKIKKMLETDSDTTVDSLWLAKAMHDFGIERWRYATNYLEPIDAPVTFKEFVKSCITDYDDLVNEDYGKCDIDIISIWEYALELETATIDIIDKHCTKYHYGEF